MATVTLDKIPCTELKGVGPRTAESLNRLGINTLQDLLFHLPLRYQDRTQIVPIAHLRAGDYAVVEGAVKSTRINLGRRRSLLCELQDGTGSITLRFFYFNVSQQRALETRDVRVRCFGEIRWGPRGLEMIHPDYHFVDSQDNMAKEENLTPIYPTTQGLQQTTLRKLTDQVLALLNHDNLADYLPARILQSFGFCSLIDALRYLHRPPADAAQDALKQGVHPAQQRLVFEELLAQQLSLRQLRCRIQQQKAPKLPSTGRYCKVFLARLAFNLTTAQQRVVDEISRDLCHPRPMSRLVQGDVGCGKTVVAALAVLQALENGYQTAIMAPTELLAEQHFTNFQAWLKPLQLQVAFLSGGLTTKLRQEALANIATGKAQVIVGTHALFQGGVEFANLALIVVDEQHRFGVHQRLALRLKGMQHGYYPHQLIMTATPIPRTLAMTAYADLDVSIVDELPPNRTPVTTAVIASNRRAEVMQHVGQACQQGKQVYWVCTLIEESEQMQLQAAQDIVEVLQQTLPELRIALVHGRLPAQQKQGIMHAFKNAEIDMLVATTVIEVGVDVPNASLMIIENPERLGLSQLHQLRGRVGRGESASHCVLLYQHPLSSIAKQRLAVLRETHDGFKIAQKDLELRGPGEMLGTRQTGLMQFKVADLSRDAYLLSKVQQTANCILAENTELVASLLQRWLKENQEYGLV